MKTERCLFCNGRGSIFKEDPYSHGPGVHVYATLCERCDGDGTVTRWPTDEERRRKKGELDG